MKHTGSRVFMIEQVKYDYILILFWDLLYLGFPINNIFQCEMFRSFV